MRPITITRRFSMSSPLREAFVEELQKNFIPTSTFQRTLLSCGSAAISLLNPYRGDMIACLGEVTGESAIKHMREKMLETSEGSEILRDMPRINSKTVSLNKLSELPENTLGRVYADFMRDNNITADSRLPVQFISDPEMAYIMQRYREVHDLVHATLFMKTNMLGEVSTYQYRIFLLNKGINMCQLKLNIVVSFTQILEIISGYCEMGRRDSNKVANVYQRWHLGSRPSFA